MKEVTVEVHQLYQVHVRESFNVYDRTACYLAVQGRIPAQETVIAYDDTTDSRTAAATVAEEKARLLSDVLKLNYWRVMGGDLT